MGAGIARTGYYFRMATRNIKTKKVRAVLTIAGIAVGIITIVTLQAISDGVNCMIRENAEKLFGGGVILTTKNPTSIAEMPEGLVDVLESSEDIEYAVGIIVFATQIGTSIFPLYGVVPEKMRHIIQMPIVEGRAPYENETDTVLIGPSVAKQLHVKLNDTLPITVPGGGSKIFRVVGIGGPSSAERDLAIVMSLKAAQQLLGVEGYVSMIFVRPKKNVDPAALAKSLEEAMPNAEATEQTEVMEQVAQILDRVDLALKILGGIGLFVAALGTVNTITTSVMERIREIGILKSIGAKRSHILFIFISEAFIISTIGGVIGAFLGAAIAYAIKIFTEQLLLVSVPVLITPSLIAYGVALAIVTGTIAAIPPSFRGASIPPVEALRYI